MLREAALVPAAHGSIQRVLNLGAIVVRDRRAIGRYPENGTGNVVQHNMVIFKQSTPGPREVSAHTHGKSPTISADGPLLLQLGSIDVLQLVTRH